jgi:asparagine synthase (glutamine-hydrolysing)
MWHSLEVRVPFLDHKVVEFAASIPAKYKVHGMTKKYVLIKALEDIIPKHILERRKQGFSIPLSDWIRGPLRDFVRGHLTGAAISKTGFFDAAAVENLIDEHERRVRNHETKIWTLLVFMVWHGLYFDR